jgi:hypothetical protein
LAVAAIILEPSIIQQQESQDRLDNIDFPQDLTWPCAFVSKVPMHQSAHHFLFVTVLTLRDEITILSISVLFFFFLILAGPELS